MYDIGDRGLVALDSTIDAGWDNVFYMWLTQCICHDGKRKPELIDE